MAIAWVGLGSNLGDPARQVRDALKELETLPRCRMLRRSRLYHTPPWGPQDQSAYANAVAELETHLEPHALLERLQALEIVHGRIRRGRWGPRTLDLDLLLYDGHMMRSDNLVIPHPRLHQRAFVLVPLAELEPALEVPGRGRVCDLLAGVDTTGVVPWSTPE